MRRRRADVFLKKVWKKREKVGVRSLPKIFKRGTIDNNIKEVAPNGRPARFFADVTSATERAERFRLAAFDANAPFFRRKFVIIERAF